MKGGQRYAVAGRRAHRPGRRQNAGTREDPETAGRLRPNGSQEASRFGTGGGIRTRQKGQSGAAIRTRSATGPPAHRPRAPPSTATGRGSTMRYRVLSVRPAPRPGHRVSQPVGALLDAEDVQAGPVVNEGKVVVEHPGCPFLSLAIEAAALERGGAAQRQRRGRRGRADPRRGPRAGSRKQASTEARCIRALTRSKPSLAAAAASAMRAPCGLKAATETAAVHPTALPAAEGVMPRVCADPPSVPDYFLLTAATLSTRR